MAQAERLVAEVEPHLRLLSRQVKKLERRQEVELQLRETEEKYYATLSTRNQTEINRLNKDLSGAEKEYREGFKDLEVIQNELATLARSASRQEVFASLQTNTRKPCMLKMNWNGNWRCCRVRCKPNTPRPASKILAGWKKDFRTKIQPRPDCRRAPGRRSRSWPG